MGRAFAKVVIVLCLGTAALAQVISPEQQAARAALKGWNKATWVMTEQEVIAAFGGAAHHLSQPQRDTTEKGAGWLVTAAIDSFDIGGTSVSARFLFDRAGHLDAVFLGSAHNATAESVADKTNRSAVIAALRDDFEKLMVLLAEKYGPPTVDTERADSGIARHDAAWALPTTRIELELVRFETMNIANLRVMYTPASNDKDKL
jgi:hypothetical protein